MATNFLFDSIRYISCFENDNLQLPLVRTSNDYYDDLKAVLELYKEESSSINIGLTDSISMICGKLLLAVNKYYQGFPVAAYNEIESLMNIFKDNKVILLEKGTEWFYRPEEDELNLFRMRPISENRVYSRKEIFHTPFAAKELVSSCRYSISGYPCLYLGTTLVLCHKETSGANYDMKIASHYKLTRNYQQNGLSKFSVLDLATRPKTVVEKLKAFLIDDSTSSGFINIDIGAFFNNYLLWYPVIAACSFIRKIRDSQHTFVPEYIIPQLILQWTRNKIGDAYNAHQLCGIRYFSCNSKEAYKLGYNYVFPVCNYTKDSEYCSVLAASFTLSKPELLIKEDGHYEKTYLSDLQNQLITSRLSNYNDNT